MNFHFQMPDRSAAMFSSDGQLLRNSPRILPKKAKSFEYMPSNEGSTSPMLFQCARNPDMYEVAQQQQLEKEEGQPQEQNSPYHDDGSYTFSERSTDEDSIEYERNINRLHEQHYEERVVRHHGPFSSLFQRKSPQKFDRRQFLPQSSTVFDDDPSRNKYPTYVCPICNTPQREFFTVSSAPRQFEGPGGFIAFYFAIYVIGSLYIFGLQEGWGKLDCIYFAVITLTTAGLGDFVPTSDGAKIMCSIFIYFGVACIGLLLGSYIAGMLDERSHREAVANKIKACPNCARIQNVKDAAERRRRAVPQTLSDMHAMSSQGIASEDPMGPASKKMRRSDLAFQSERMSPHSANLAAFQSERISPRSTDMAGFSTPKSAGKSPDLHYFESPSTQSHLLGSPMTTQILGRQSHTRHSSMDFGSSRNGFAASLIPPLSSSSDSRRARNYSMDIPATVVEGVQGVQSNDGADAQPGSKESANPVSPNSNPAFMRFSSSGASSDEYSLDTFESDSSSMSEDDDIEEKYSRMKNVKYVFVTLREALVNSMVIIAFGCMGFYLIEGFSFIDSWYFTTVLLTTVGYGDIVPITQGGKLFATVYLLVAGTILLNNMSMISMIPLELRKRRMEQAVLTQFGDSLDDEALRELATGPVIQRINLASKDERGLDECTREMFALAMLIRLGKVTEDDIKLTFAAFRRLDIGNEGVLNSKAIIGGMIQKRASQLNLCHLAAASNPRRRHRDRSRNQAKSRSSATVNSSTASSMSSWINPAAFLRDSSGTSSIPSLVVGNSEQAPLMFRPQAVPTYGNPIFIPTTE
eukprot:CAMPEP_0178745592 /NCGR_PEP_ID=MMETSP0744-20121128/7377_1 /TAXON_ID=913974 /ORGANISM="Nitzschia punctata, Strain CCMP561" /LENGTH=807 /DNA_ID=CAMNT_0020398785 /DNA_START=5 /DNA_END=2428 /DNA_ORIENTATION=-